MAEGIPITQKLGCEKNALDSCLLVKASVEAISTFVKQYFELSEDFLGFQNHYFKSSVRQVTKSEIRSALSTRKHDKGNKGFLDACLKYHKA